LIRGDICLFIYLLIYLFIQHYKNYPSSNYRFLIRNASIKVLRIRYSAHRMPLRLVCISEQAAISPCSIKSLIFTAETKCLLRGTSCILKQNSGDFAALAFVFLPVGRCCPCQPLSEPFHRCAVRDSSSSACSTDQTAGNLPNSEAVSAINGRWIEQYFYFRLQTVDGHISASTAPTDRLSMCGASITFC